MNQNDLTQYQKLMIDKTFDPFGSLTIAKLKEQEIDNLEEINNLYEKGGQTNKKDYYYEKVILKTKDDPSIFDPIKLRIEAIGATFSEKNIIQLQRQAQQGQKDNTLFQMKARNSRLIANDDVLKQNYLHLLKIRSLLYQPCSFQQCIANMRSEVHKFGAFEVYEMKDSKNGVEKIVFFDFENSKIYFIQSTFRTELVFKQVVGVNAAFNDDQIYLTTNSDVGQSKQNQKFKAKYSFQRDLIVQYFHLVIEKNRENKIEKISQINMIEEDIIVPPKAILSYLIQIKVKGIIRNVDFTLGVNNIVVHEWIAKQENNVQPDKKQLQIKLLGEQKEIGTLVIHHIIPFNHPYFYVDNNCEPNQIICRQGNEVASFYFKTELEASNMKEALMALHQGKIHNDQIYIHIPDLKKLRQDNLSTVSQRFIKEKSKQITSKIDHHKAILQLLLKTRYLLDVQGERNDYEFSDDQGLQNSPINEKGQNIQDEDENTYDPDYN